MNNLLGADKRIRNQDNKTPFDLTHDPNVRSLLDEKGTSNSIYSLFFYFFVVIFSNYKSRQMQQNGDGNDEDDDSD